MTGQVPPGWRFVDVSDSDRPRTKYVQAAAVEAIRSVEVHPVLGGWPGSHITLQGGAVVYSTLDPAEVVARLEAVLVEDDDDDGPIGAGFHPTAASRTAHPSAELGVPRPAVPVPG